MKYLTLFSSLFFFTPAHSSVFILDQQVESEKGLTLIERHAPGTTYSNFVLQIHRELAQKKNLFQLGAKLRISELNKNYEDIYQQCQTLDRLKYDAQWGPEDRTIIRRCLVHLSQMSSDPRRRVGYKTEAKQLDGPKTWENLSAPTSVTQYFDRALINGYEVELNEEAIKYPNSKARVTLVSNQYQDITKILTRDEFEKWQPNLKAIVSGDCHTGFRYDANRLNFSQLAQAQVVAEDCTISVMKDMTNDNRPSLATNFKRKRNGLEIPKWIWWVAAGTVGYHLYQNSQDSSSRPHKPTTKRGF